MPQDHVDPAPIPVLEAAGKHDQSWPELAPRYGVTAADPPWKSSLSATCECLAAGGAPASLDRRHAEDQPARSTYRDVPGPSGNCWRWPIRSCAAAFWAKTISHAGCRR